MRLQRRVQRKLRVLLGQHQPLGEPRLRRIRVAKGLVSPGKPLAVREEGVHEIVAPIQEDRSVLTFRQRFFPLWLCIVGLLVLASLSPPLSFLDRSLDTSFIRARVSEPIVSQVWVSHSSLL